MLKKVQEKIKLTLYGLVTKKKIQFAFIYIEVNKILY